MVIFAIFHCKLYFEYESKDYHEHWDNPRGLRGITATSQTRIVFQSSEIAYHSVY